MLGWLRRLVGAESRNCGAELGSVTGPGAVSSTPNDSIALGAQALREGRFADAIAELEAALEQHPDGAIHRLLARAREAAGDQEGALDELQLALHLQPDDPETQVDLAERLLFAGRREEALELCDRGIGSARDAQLHLRLARCLKMLDRLPQAIAQYELVLQSRPRDAGILSSLGLAQAASGAFAAAEASYARALDGDPDCVEALHNLALLRREQGAVDAARDLFGRALALRPESIDTQSALAHALRDLGRTEEALALYRRVLARRPQPVDALLNFSYALLMSGQLAEGWDAYERRLTFPDPPVSAPPPAQRWSGEAAVAVHVVGEQGLGDQIMFASCLPDLLRRATHVSLTCAPNLERLFRRSFRGVELRSRDSGAPQAARWAALGSLPSYFRRRVGDFPVTGRYLQADPDAVARWRQRLDGLGPGPRIGLSWRGGTLRTRGHLRSIPVAAFAPLASASPATWFSLQYGQVDEDATRLGKMLGLHHWPEIGGDLDECAALIEALDLVVTIDTTAAHLAGALGQRVWILLSQAPEWRYGLSGAALPWYPSARLFRQPAAGDWRTVIDAVKRALVAECRKKEKAPR
ncbi:MAG TPA: tetratricopeptide repeat protein [Burkholderiales bacterium]|nr:tetratricopeptide repeat protein [Burkholderiales bacterium]